MLKKTAKRAHGGKQKEKSSESGSVEEMATLHIQQAKIFLRAVKRLKEMHQLLFFHLCSRPIANCTKIIASGEVVLLLEATARMALFLMYSLHHKE